MDTLGGNFLENSIFSATLLCGAVLCSQTALSQTIPAGVEPGRIEDRFDAPQGPRAQQTTRQGLESTIPPAQAAQIPLRIKGFRILGAQAISQAELEAAVAPFKQDDGTLLNAFQASAAITQLYGEQGYLLSRAIVPPQELLPSGAVIKLQVIEGFVERVVLPADNGTRAGLLKQHVANIEGAKPLNADDLEREILLANDIPGLSVRTNLSAAPRTANASILTLTHQEDPGGWSFTLDNRGSDASGPLQFSVSGDLNNALGWNERLSGGLTLTGPSGGSSAAELLYLFGAYEQVINADGLRFGLSGNISRGDPDSEVLTPLGYETDALNLSAEISYPFIRTRARNLTATLAFDLKNAKSVSTGGVASNDRLRILRGELAFDTADQFNGTNQVLLSLSKGIDGLGSTSNSNPQASRSPGKVNFTKLGLDLSRIQKLGTGLSLSGKLSGQWTNDPLLSSQECGYGGTQFGRGFDASVLTGDRCLMASLEMRYDLRDLGQSGLDYTQLYAFADTGRIWNIDAPLGTPGSDNASSFGLGARFGAGAWSFDISAARSLETPNSGDVNNAWRGFFALSTKF